MLIGHGLFCRYFSAGKAVLSFSFHAAGELIELGGIASFELFFEFIDIVLQGEEQAFGVVGGKDDAAFYLSLGSTRHDADEVENEFGRGMGDDCQIGVGTLSHFFGKFDLNFVTGRFVVFHFVYFFR